MDRTHSTLAKMLQIMDTAVIGVLGAKGAGKTQFAREAYYYAKEHGKNAFFIDAKLVMDISYQGCSGNGCYFFVDNAQVLCKMKLLPAMIIQGHVLLAFSSTGMQINGYSKLNCPVHPEKEVYLGPFTDGEVQLYLAKNSPSKTYNEKTTLPVIMKRVLILGEGYQEIMSDLAFHIIQKLVGSLEESRDSAEILRLLHSYFHLRNSMEIGHLQQLRNCGLVYCKSPDSPRDWELVFERKFMFDRLLQAAASHHELFALYDIGGAQELRFSDCCHIGEIRATCLGSTCHTITGTRPKLNTISFTCDHFCQQATIGQQIQLPSGLTCCLIKLALNHPAIDFIIYKNLAGVQARVLYFVQVSTSTYQNREKEKKFKAVKESFDSLGGESPFTFYREMFGMTRSTEVYYIYSTSAPVPTNDSFSTIKQDKERVYFHQM